jgi:membrane protease subunit HflK
MGRFESLTNTQGLHWRLPYPLEQHQIVNLNRLYSLEIKTTHKQTEKSTKPPTFWFLSQDQQLLGVGLLVQYRIKNTVDYLFNVANPEQSLREIAQAIAYKTIYQTPAETFLNLEPAQKTSLGKTMQQAVQAELDKYKAGLLITSIDIYPPHFPPQVEPAFKEILKAKQGVEKAKKEAQGYAEGRLAQAQKEKERLKEEAQVEKTKTVLQAKENTQGFQALLPEYQKAPQATTDWFYTNVMQQIYAKTNKVFLETNQQPQIIFNALTVKEINPSSNSVSIKAAEKDSSPSSLGAAEPQKPSSADTSRSRENSRSRETDLR